MESAGQANSTDGCTYPAQHPADYSHPMPATPTEPNPTRLAVYLRQAARAAGYDVDTPRSGATKKLSADTGIPPATLSRALNGEAIPNISTFQPLANVLDVPVVDMLTEAQLITPSDEADTVTRVTPVPSVHTPEDAALALGIHPDDRALFVQLVQRLTHHRDGGVT